jgi:hypothetical protein
MYSEGELIEMERRAEILLEPGPPRVYVHAERELPRKELEGMVLTDIRALIASVRKRQPRSMTAGGGA